MREPSSWGVIAGAAVGLTVLLSVIGWLVTEPMTIAVASFLSIDALVIQDPSDIVVARLWTVLLFAWPALAGGIAAVVVQFRSGAVSPLPSLATHVGAALAATVAGVVLRLLWMRLALTDGQDLDIDPMVSMVELVPVRWGLVLGAVAATLTAFVMQRRHRRRDP